MQAQVTQDVHNREDRLGSKRKPDAKTDLNAPLDTDDVVAILEDAHEETTRETLKSLDEPREISTGAQLLENAALHGVDREALQRAIVERVRENKASEPVASTKETEKERLGLPEDATRADRIKENTLRKQVDPLIRGLTDHLNKLEEKGLEKGLTEKEIWLDKDTLRMEVPEWVKFRLAHEKFIRASGVSGVLALATSVGGIVATLSNLPNSFLNPILFSAGFLMVGQVLFAIAGRTVPPDKLDPIKPTNSPAMNDLFAFCKNNGISPQMFTEGKNKFFGFKM